MPKASFSSTYDVVPAGNFLFAFSLSSVVLLAALAGFRSALAADPPEHADPPPIPAAASTKTGLLLEPPLDLDWLTREKFIEMSSTVGRDKIGKKWTSPVVTLPAHAPSGVKGLTKDGLTKDEVKAYMTLAKRLFEQGESVPISDVGLISTQEDIIRRPMLNHVAAFANADAHVYLLVQRTSTDKGWSYFSIVRDLNLDPPLDYFGEVNKEGVKFEGISCFKCHAPGATRTKATAARCSRPSRIRSACWWISATCPPTVGSRPRRSPNSRRGWIKSSKLHFP